MRYVCTLFKPPDGFIDFDAGYSPEWVNKLNRNLKRWSDNPQLVVVTDFEGGFEEDIEVYPFVHEERGWACIMETFRPEVVKDRALLVGLDTIMVGPLKEIEEAEGLIAPLDPYHAPSICNAVVAVDDSSVWEKWEDQRELHLGDPLYDLFGQFSEMKWLRHHTKPKLWDDILPNQIVSYKAHVKKNGVGDAKIVYFHGNPKPNELDLDWIQENWK